MKTLIFIFVFFVLSTFLVATIINVPVDQPTIQQGINVTVDGDTVLVQPGTYVENINYNGKNITVASLFLTTQDTTYISQTIIDGSQVGNVVTFESGEGSTAVLSGFTLTNGVAQGSYPNFNGGGILCYYSSPSLNNLVIKNNSAYAGGGIACHHSNLSLENITIKNNSADSGSGRIGFVGCYYPTLTNVCITNNTTDSMAGGIYVFYSNVSLYNVTISENIGSSNWTGGGIVISENGNVVLTNSIVVNNSPVQINLTYSGNILVTYSDIEGGWPGTGNIDEDPLFVGTGEYPYSLLEDSPCIDAGIPDTTGLNLPPWDIIGNIRIWDGDGNGSAIIDMGAYEYGAPPYVEVEDNIIVQTSEVFLHQNYPNPFNPTTTINYQLPENSKVELAIYNIRGQKVKTLVNEIQASGEYTVVWNGKDEQDRSVSSGIYFYKLKTKEDSKIRKMILLK